LHFKCAQQSVLQLAMRTVTYETDLLHLACYRLHYKPQMGGSRESVNAVALCGCKKRPCAVTSEPDVPVSC